MKTNEKIPKIDSICIVKRNVYVFPVISFKDDIFLVQRTFLVPEDTSVIVIRGRPRGRCSWDGSTNTPSQDFVFRTKKCAYVTSPEYGEFLIERECLIMLDCVGQ